MFFSKILRQFLDVEKQYDVETAHYCEQQMQLLWNRRIKEQLKLYEIYFNPWSLNYNRIDQTLKHS
jgi:hypothetical protein